MPAAPLPTPPNPPSAQSPADPTTPLAGVRVLDLSRVLAGPTCAMLLGDLGADVIKVERPGVGDITRAWGPPFVAGESAYYLCCNRNKRSIALDLASPEGVACVKQLAARADVVIENFRGGQLDRLGLGWEVLQAENPALIGCSISGYGRTGPDRDLGGYDVVIQGVSGLMSITGAPDGPPMKVGVAVVDMLTALYAGNAILAALFARAQGARAAATPPPRGPIIDLALLDCALAGLANVAQAALVTGVNPARHGNAHPHIVPYQLFAAAGDSFLLVALGSDEQWPKLCELLGRPALARDPAYQTNALRVQNRDALIPLLDERFRGRPATDWQTALTAAGIPCGPVNTIPQALANPQVAARGMLQQVNAPGLPDLQLVANPIRWMAPGATAATGPDALFAPRLWRPPPRLDEHRQEILRELAQPRDPETRTGAHP